MKIEDGKGKNGDMSVSSTQRGNVSAKIDYAYRTIGILGNVHSYSLGFTF